jgi:pimeloyl-ACP methyl ester carboxylesterase
VWRLIVLFLCCPAFADTVIFLGGYGSTSSNMKCWQNGAERQAAYAGYKFKTIRFPSGVTGYAGAVNESNSAAQIRELADYVNSHPDEKFVIAAHSSGSSIAFLAADKIKNPKNVDYVNLSGFSIPKSMYRLHKVTSIKEPSSYGNCSRAQRWCRHFSLVNTTPPPDLRLSNLADGYQGCNTNLSWLPKKGAESAHAEKTTPAAAPSKPADPNEASSGSF